MGLRKTEITIATKDGTETREGYAVGPLSIYRYPSGGWSVTHNATGMRITSADTRSEALTVARRLRDCGVDWSKVTPSTAHKVAPQVKAAIRGHADLSGMAAVEAAIATKAAASQHIFCPRCDRILDQARTVVVWGPDHHMVRCAPCTDRWATRHAIDLRNLPEGWQVDDGRRVPASTFRSI